MIPGMTDSQEDISKLVALCQGRKSLQVSRLYCLPLWLPLCASAMSDSWAIAQGLPETSFNAG